MAKKKASRLERKFYIVERERRWDEQGGKCFYCKKPIARKDATFDHVIPRSQCGGYHSSLNAVVACGDCNHRKANKPIFVPEPLDRLLADLFERLELRTRVAEYRLDFASKGSFSKWHAYHVKRGKWRYQLDNVALSRIAEYL